MGKKVYAVTSTMPVDGYTLKGNTFEELANFSLKRILDLIFEVMYFNISIIMLTKILPHG